MTTKNKRKVCHFTSTHPYKDTRIFLKQCTSLTKNYDVYLVNTNSPIEETQLNNIQLITVNYQTKSRIKRVLFTTFKVYKKALALNADIYHFHDPDLIFYGFLLRLRGKKVIYDVHESYAAALLDRSYIPVFFRKPLSLIFNVFEKFFSAFFTYIITATPYINSEFKFFNKKRETINNFPILNELNLDNVDTPKENAVCFVGYLSKERGFYEMLEATKRAGLTFYIAGDMPKEFKEIVQNSEHVVYLGFINRKQFAELMSKCLAGFVLYHPCRNHINAQPNKLFEYMSAKLPVIASYFPLWKDIIEKYDCGKCCNPNDVNHITTILNWIKENKDELPDLGKNGFEAVKAVFNWSIEEKKLFEVYERVLK